MKSTRSLLKFPFLISMIFFGTLASPANAGLFDFAKTKTESSQIFLVYDLAGFQGTPTDLKDRVREALTYHGDNAFVKDNILSGTAPRFPEKLTLKPFNFGPVSIAMPACNGSAFTISSSDNSQASTGDSARYMACGFPYAGGYRVDFYASYSSKNGGLEGLFSGKTIAKLVTGAVGINSDPQAYINRSIAKMEELFTSNGWKFEIVELTPAIAGKTAVADPLVHQQTSETKKSADRGKRMAARAELNKLGIDASDRPRFIKAIQSADEDIVALFVEAGAVDVRSKDEAGKSLTEYTTSLNILSLLASN